MKKTIHIVSIGAAIQDVFMQGDIFRSHRSAKGGQVQEFALGTKNEIEAISYSTGGGATNASVTFARAGLHSSFMGRIGEDVAGQNVLDHLHAEGIDTSLVMRSKKAGTGYSAIMLAPNGERTVLTYRGASLTYNIKNSDFHHVQPDWFYISSLSGDIDALETVVDYAVKHRIKIAINPGAKELKSRAFKKLLNHFNILSVNKEEMEELFGTADLETLLKKANELVPCVVVTDGARGSWVIDSTNIYKAGMYKDVKVVDRLGAGDAFSSGFTAYIAMGKTVPEAMTYASANSTSVVQQIGAKTGILREGVRLAQMPVKIEAL